MYICFKLICVKCFQFLLKKVTDLDAKVLNAIPKYAIMNMLINEHFRR